MAGDADDEKPVFDYVVFLGTRFGFWLIRLLPKAWAYGLARFCGRMVAAVERKRKSRIIKNALYTGFCKTEAEALELARKNYEHIATIFCDMAYLGGQSKQKGIETVILNAPQDIIDRAIARDEASKGEQFIVASAHYGNWEYAGITFCKKTHRRMVSVMRPLHNRYLNTLIRRARSSDLHELCDERGALRQMLRTLKQGDSVSIVADQHAYAECDNVLVKFMGKWVSAHSSVAALHLRTGVPILVGGCRRDPHNYRQFFFDMVRIIDYRKTGDDAHDLREVTQQYLDAVEDLIRIAPEQWVWEHRRFIELRPDWPDSTRPDDPGYSPHNPTYSY